MISQRLDASDTLDCHRIASVILYLSLHDTKRSPIVDLECNCEIRKIRKSGRSDGNFLAGSENVLKPRLRYLMFRIVRRLNPLVIDLRRDPRVNDGVSANSRSDFICAIARLHNHRQALVLSNYLRRSSRFGRAQTIFDQHQHAGDQEACSRHRTNNSDQFFGEPGTTNMMSHHEFLLLLGRP